MEDARWKGIPVCPNCCSVNPKHYKLNVLGVFKGLYKCEDSRMRFTTETQIDETFLGGKNRKRKKKTQGRSLAQVPVMGLLLEGKVYTELMPNANGDVLKSVIYDLIRQSSTTVGGYSGSFHDFVHKVIKLNLGIYVGDGYRTNSIEGFWNQLKRDIIGIYHLVSPKHLTNYCEEFHIDLIFNILQVVKDLTNF